MEDRYLFKAKRTDNEEWEIGNLITNVFFRLGQSIPYILCSDKAEYDCFEDFTEGNGIFEVRPDTICQCTCLKDKNGKLIWENDIIKDKHGNFYKAFWQDNYYQFFWICVKSDIFSIGAKWDLWSFKSFEIEVIGNIFDNKELLEVRDSMTEKNNKEPSPCSGCKYEKSTNIKELLAFAHIVKELIPTKRIGKFTRIGMRRI